MCGILILIILSTKIIYVLSGGLILEEEPRAPYTILPLIFIKTNDGFETPSRVDTEDGFLHGEKLKFRYKHFDDQLLFCPINSKSDKKKIIKTNEIIQRESSINNIISNHCLLEKSPSIVQKMKTEFTRCSQEAQPVITKVLQKEPRPERNNGNQTRKGSSNKGLQEVICGPPGTPAREYRFGYQLCLKPGLMKNIKKIMLLQKSKEPPFKLADFEIYKFCHHDKRRQVLYTVHTIMSPRLLTDQHLEEEREKDFEMDADGYQFFATKYENLGTIYEKIEKTRLKNQSEIDLGSSKRSKRPLFKMKTLVPPEDFAFAIWKKPTYHYLNINLMHEDLIPLWDFYSKYIREYASDVDEAFHIYTGAFKIPTESATEILTIEKIQIPQIWVKILHYEDEQRVKDTYRDKHSNKKLYKGMAIIANNYFSHQVDHLITENYCKTDKCPYFGKIEFKRIYKFVRCCKVDMDLRALFGVDLQIDNYLEIDAFSTVPEEAIGPQNDTSET